MSTRSSLARAFAAAAVVAWPLVVRAAPAPPPCAPEVIDVHQLFVVAGTPVACFADTGDCLALPELVRIAHPAIAAPAAELRRAGQTSATWTACAGATCKPVHARLAAALAATATPAPTVAVTRDLSMAVVRGDQTDLWNIALDSKVAIAMPAYFEHHNSGRPPALGGVAVVGNTLIAEWAPCAGPCELGAVIDHLGAHHGALFPSGIGVELDAHRIAVVGDEAEAGLTVIDTRTYRQTSIAFEDNSALDAAIAVAGTNEVVAMWRGRGDGVQVVRVTIGAKLVVTPIVTIPRCGPP